MRQQLRRMLKSVGAAVRPSVVPHGPFRHLKVGLVADELTSSCLRHVCQVIELTPKGFERQLSRMNPDLMFVESAWQGPKHAWRYRVAAYPDHPERNNADLARVVAMARELGIPAVFWNKEDDVHFDRFISSARLFDHIFTVDERCVPRYRAAIDRVVTVAPLMFAVEPAIHHPAAVSAPRQGSCFVGSYGWHIHDLRRERQDMLLGAAADSLGLAIYDRNSDRKGVHYRYPPWPNVQVHDKVLHERTGALYQRHLVSLNINTVEGSGTMFSRRLIEIIASGGLAVTTPALSVELLFKDFCHVVDNAEQATELFERLASDGYSPRDREMMAGGAAHMLAHHTYQQRIETILDAVGRRPR